MLETAQRRENINTPVNPIESKDKIIKTDRIDRKTGFISWRARLLPPAYILVGAGAVRVIIDSSMFRSIANPEFYKDHRWLYPLYESLNNPMLIANGVEAAALLIPTAYVLYKMRRDQGNLYHDNTLQTTAEPLVYKGKKPLNIGGINLRKGQNALFVSLPRPQIGTHLTPEAVNLYGKATQLALDGIKTRFARQKYGAVIVDAQSFTASTSLANACKVSNGKLLSGKDISPKKGSSIIITAEDLERVQFKSTDQLKAALDALGDVTLNDYFALAQTAASEIELQNIQNKINIHIKTRLHTHALNHFSEPQSIKTKEPPFKKRIYEMIQLFTDSAGKLLLQRGSADTGFYRRNLYQVLSIDEETTVEKLDPKSAHIKAQLLYIIYELLRKNSLGELVQEESNDPLLVAEKLAVLGFPIAESSDSLNAITEKRLDYLKQIGKALAPTLLAALIYMGGPQIKRIVLNMDADLPTIFSSVPTQVKELMIGNISESNYSIHSKHRSAVPGFALPPTLDWETSSYGKLQNKDKSYYTLETANKIVNGEWVINQDRKRVLDLPSTSDITEKDYVSISGFLELPFTENFRFKLPILEGTKLAYLYINLGSDASLKYTIYELTDGTIEVEMKQDLFNFVPGIDIVAYFTEASVPQIRAVSQLPKLDDSKIDPGNRDKIKQIATSVAAKDVIKAVAQKVQNDHLYSLSSQYQVEMYTYTSGEEIVNTVYKDRVCDCDTCTAEAALESTLVQTPDQFVNVAFGYRNSAFVLDPGDGVKIQRSLLRGDERHVSMVTDKGVIVDPTPSISNGDEITEKYLQSLKNRKDNFYKDFAAFYSSEQAFFSKIRTGSNPGNYLSIARMLVSFGLIGGLYPLGKYAVSSEARKRITQVTRDARRGLLLHSLSKEDLKLADSFFPWISYGGDTEMKIINDSSLSKQEMFRGIKQNYTDEALAKYRNDPTRFEGRAGISGLQALKMRFISYFLELI